MEPGKPNKSPQPDAASQQPSDRSGTAGQTGWRGTPPPKKNKPLFVLATVLLAAWFVTLAVLAYLV